jgi:hypothetical protein
LETYRGTVEKLAGQNKELVADKLKVTAQLKSLFTVYNKQKTAVDEVAKLKSEADLERRTAQARIEELERANAKLKTELNRSEDARKDLVTEHLVPMNYDPIA